MNLHQAPACHLKEALQLYLNDNTQTSQLRKENLWGKKLGCWCMHSQSSQLLINRCFCPIGVPITINHCHVQAICLRITINLRITLSGHQESRNSAKNFDLNPPPFFCHLPGMRLSSTAPNHTAEWQLLLLGAEWDSLMWSKAQKLWIVSFCFIPTQNDSGVCKKFATQLKKEKLCNQSQNSLNSQMWRDLHPINIPVSSIWLVISSKRCIYGNVCVQCYFSIFLDDFSSL